MSHSEYLYKAAGYTIRALSNLHAGAGSENYGVIDNLVQRDATTGFPCIHSSSLKGSLKEHCCEVLGMEKDDPFILYVFGNEKDADEEAETNKTNSGKQKRKVMMAGKVRFLQADLLCIPVRSDIKAFFRATCPTLLANAEAQISRFIGSLPVISQLQTLGSFPFAKGFKAYHFDTKLSQPGLLERESILITPYTSTGSSTVPESLLGDDIALVEDSAFITLVSDFHLPVVARNYLENGVSRNLWYEQVLPRETRFFFILLFPDPHHDPIVEKHLHDLERAITEYPVQIGANASVGYGFCEINKVAS